MSLLRTIFPFLDRREKKDVAIKTLDSIVKEQDRHRKDAQLRLNRLLDDVLSELSKEAKDASN